MKASIFWDMTPCSPLKVNRPPSSTPKNKPSKQPATRNYQAGSTCCLLHTGFLIGFFFIPENGSDMFL
jgi:hypothetical protein